MDIKIYSAEIKLMGSPAAILVGKRSSGNYCIMEHHVLVPGKEDPISGGFDTRHFTALNDAHSQDPDYLFSLAMDEALEALDGYRRGEGADNPYFSNVSNPKWAESQTSLLVNLWVRGRLPALETLFKKANTQELLDYIHPIISLGQINTIG